MSTKKLLFWVTCYSIAMGFLESAVVIYLRASLYPGGFTFPLVPMHRNLAVVEIWREAGTLVMLLATGMLVLRRWHKFPVFEGVSRGTSFLLTLFIVQALLLQHGFTPFPPSL